MSNFDNHRVCPVCKDDMTTRNPRMLPCVHSFCTQCLEGLVQHQKWSKKQIITCPVCRKTVKLPSQGVTAIPGNFLIHEDQQNKANPQRQRKCSVCKEKNKAAVVWCRECYKDLCQACKKKHLKIKGFQDHSFRSINSGICPEHREAIQYVCDFCDDELCSTCAYSDKHATHLEEITKIEDNCVMLKDTINTKTIKMQSHLSNKMLHLEYVNKTINKRKDEVKAYADQVCDEIHKARDLLLTELDQEEANVKQITLTLQNNLNKMEKAIELCKEAQYDPDFYSMLKCLDVSVEYDTETGKVLCYNQVSVPSFYPYRKEAISLGKFEHTKENIENYPIPKYGEDPYSLEKISVCTDTIYELFLSRRRAQYMDMVEEDNDNVDPHNKKPVVAAKPKIQKVSEKPVETQYEPCETKPNVEKRPDQSSSKDLQHPYMSSLKKYIAKTKTRIEGQSESSEVEPYEDVPGFSAAGTSSRKQGHRRDRPGSYPPDKSQDEPIYMNTPNVKQMTMK